MSYQFTEAENKFVCSLVRNLEGPIAVNWEKVVPETGLANKASAQRTWNRIKAKLNAVSGEGGSTLLTKNGDVSAAKRKDRDSGSAGDANEDNGTPSPVTKRAKKATTGKKGKKQDDRGEEAKVKMEHENGTA